MKFVFVFLSLLAMLTSVAAAPMTATAVALVEVRNDPGGNVIFVFSVDGQFSKSQLKGNVQIQGGDGSYPLGCNQVSESTVQCTTSRKTGGNNVIVTFGGATFWAYVPEVVAPTQYCYSLWDYWGEDTNWVDYGPFCQDTPVSDGDVADASGYYGFSEPYYIQYFSNGVENAYCGWANPGAGYYYMDDYACFN